MKILVCISNVPDTTAKINFKDNDTQFDTQGVPFVINPNDEFGLTRAMWFKEQNGAVVDVATVGDSSVEATLRKALAIGADEAYRIDTPALDGFQVARELAALVKENEYDLVIAGRESIDYNGGMVPGIMAGILGYSFVHKCIELQIDGQTATAVREIDGGKETLTAQLPLVIGGQKGLVEEKDLKIPNMRGIMMARQKTLQVLPGIQAKSMSRDIHFAKPAARNQTTMISKDNLDELIEKLHTEAKVI